MAHNKVQTIIKKNFLTFSKMCVQVSFDFHTCVMAGILKCTSTRVYSHMCARKHTHLHAYAYSFALNDTWENSFYPNKGSRSDRIKIEHNVWASILNFKKKIGEIKFIKHWSTSKEIEYGLPIMWVYWIKWNYWYLDISH